MDNALQKISAICLTIIAVVMVALFLTTADQNRWVRDAHQKMREDIKRANGASFQITPETYPGDGDSVYWVPVPHLPPPPRQGQL